MSELLISMGVQINEVASQNALVEATPKFVGELDRQLLDVINEEKPFSTQEMEPNQGPMQ